MKLLLAGAAMAGLLAAALPAQGLPPGPPHHGWAEPMHPPATRAEIEARVAQRFAMFDADHDGVVTRAELDAFFAKRRVEWEAKRKTHRDHAFDRLDKNKDGKLSRAEFDSPPPPGDREGHGGRFGGHRGPGGWRHHHPRPGMMAALWFERLDADHDGRVTLAEAKAAALARFDRIGHDGPPGERRGGWMRSGPGGPEGPPGPGRRGDMPPPGGPQRGPGYDLPAGTPPSR